MYLFSLDFLNRGIDSWFRIEIKQGLNDALVLSRSALDLRLREQARRTEDFARSLRNLTGSELLVRLDAERRAAGASRDRRLRAGRAAGRAQHRQRVGVDAGRGGHRGACCRSAPAAVTSACVPLADGHYAITTAAPIGDSRLGAERRFVLMRFGVPVELSGLAEAVQRAYQRYGDLSAQRQPLKYNFRFALTLVLLLTLLAAIYGAICLGAAADAAGAGR